MKHPSTQASSLSLIGNCSVITGRQVCERRIGLCLYLSWQCPDQLFFSYTFYTLPKLFFSESFATHTLKLRFHHPSDNFNHGYTQDKLISHFNFFFSLSGLLMCRRLNGFWRNTGTSTLHKKPISSMSYSSPSFCHLSLAFKNGHFITCCFVSS